MVVVRVVFALAALFAFAVPRAGLAQQMDPYVSCVRCHALPVPQAQAAMVGHGTGYPPTPETACAMCHDTYLHEQDPGAPPAQRYFWPGPPLNPASFLSSLCLACHATHLPGHPNDVLPYVSASVPTPAPTSVLPLFDPSGQANQDPYLGGLVCSTCHDPHEPSFTLNGTPKFLRAGSEFGGIALLCGTCHLDEMTPPTYGADLFIPSRSNSVQFQPGEFGDLVMSVTVRNRGNAPSAPWNAQVAWVDEYGYPMPIGSLPIPTIAGDQETAVVFGWLPPPDWTAGQGFFVFSLPPSDFLPGPPREFVRTMNVTPAPTNLQVVWVGPASIDLAWNAPGGLPLSFDVYRDGVKLNIGPIYGTSYTDYGVAPETPHVYTVKAMGSDGTPSEPSNPAGGTTTASTVIRVPQDYPTIQEAIDAAAPGTSIHVAPGTYSEPISFAGKEGITVKGQDANGCIIDFGAYPQTIDLGTGYYPLIGNTLSGFTIREGQVRLSLGDVLSGCVLQGDYFPPIWAAGGFAAHCVFDTGMAVSIEPGAFFAAANSIFFSPQPFNHPYPPASSALLFNNNFVNWPGFGEYQGSGNFTGMPMFDFPGPPQSYFTASGSVTSDRGLPLNTPYGPAPDVGAFEVGNPYTPQPPGTLTATFIPGGAGAVLLEWAPSPNDPPRVLDYWIYRSTTPAFPSEPETTPYMVVPAGYLNYSDLDLVPGVTYYYQVRASAGSALPPSTGILLSAPTNTVSAGDLNQPPAPADDTAATNEDQPTLIAVLANDTDPDGDPLSVAALVAPSNGTATPNPDGSILYTPVPNYHGPDSFSYTVSDGRGSSGTAVVTITVAPVNDAPVALNDNYFVSEDQSLSLPAPGVLGNDTDADGDALEALIGLPPANGSLSLGPDGSFLYTPATGFAGLDSFTYRAGDRQAISAEATVWVTVWPVNDPPAAADQTLTTAEDAAVALTLAATDPDGDALSFAVAAGPAHGTLSGVAPNLTYTPAADYHGPDSFTFTASDGQATSAPATVSVTVTSVNDLPRAEAGPDQTGIVGQVFSFSAAASADSDGSIVAYSWNWGDGTADGTGVSPTHAFSAGGTWTVTLTVTDDAGGIAVDTLLVPVAPNLARNATAVALSTLNPASAAGLAVDGDPATAWLSRKIKPAQWLKIDLGASQSISRVRVSWPAAYYAREFRIEISTDGSSWTPRYSTETGAGGLTDVTFTAESARYVRVYCTKSYNSTSYGIAELEVYR